MVIAKDNLKQTEAKGYPLQNKNNKIISTYLKDTHREKAL